MKKIVPYIILACIAAGVAWHLLQRSGEPQGQAVSVTRPRPLVQQADIDALRTKAQSGDPAAQTSLGWIYQKGTGVKPDMKEAVKWFKQAADQNYPEALAALGEMTQAGQGVPADPVEAARLYRLAAEKGSVAGQYNLAFLYEQGLGVQKSETDAAQWYQLAAEGGDSYAQYDIGQRYKLGVGVPKDRVQAFKWLMLAANQGQADSTKLLRDLKSEMSPEELTEAAGLVKMFVPRAVKQSGHAGN